VTGYNARGMIKLSRTTNGFGIDLTMAIKKLRTSKSKKQNVLLHVFFFLKKKDIGDDLTSS
jgi:hypothetical protein